jgi:tetratricopeptide (TPR) repeat protein
LKNFDAALAEIAKMNSPLIKWACDDDGYRVRADAAFEKGDWHAAIENYTKALTASEPGERGRLNLIQAYFNLGDAQGALKEINRYCGIVCYGEFLRLQARAYLLNGQAALAAEKMKSFEVFQAYVKSEQKLNANSRIVYGSMKAPPGMALGKGILIVAVVDPVTGSFIRQCPTDNLQRFSTRYWRRRPFRVRATYEEKIDGRLLRFSGESKNLVIHDDNIGPLLIELRPSS